MHALLSGGSVTCDTRSALKVQLRMEKPPMLFSKLPKGEVLGGWSVSSSMTCQAAVVGHENEFRSIRYAARRDEVMWRVAILAAKCRIDRFDVDTRLHCLRDRVEVEGRERLPFVTINTVAHLGTGACVRKLVEPFRVADGARKGAVHGARVPRRIDGDVARPMTLHAGRLTSAGLSQTSRDRPYRAGEEEHDRANDPQGLSFEPASELPVVFPPPPLGLEPGTLWSPFTFENLREATKPAPSSAPAAAPTRPVASGLMVPCGLLIGA